MNGVDCHGFRVAGAGRGEQGVSLYYSVCFCACSTFSMQKLKKKKKTVEVVAKERKKKVEKGKIQPVK